MKSTGIDFEKTNTLLKEIYTKYKQAIYFLAFQYLRDESLAEDIVQETIIKMREKIIKQEIRSSEKLGALLATMVKGLCIDLIRRRERILFREILDYEIESESGFFNQFALKDAINRLPEKDRDIFYKRVYKDLSYRDIARDCNMSESAVRKRVERARRLVKEAWKGE